MMDDNEASRSMIRLIPCDAVNKGITVEGSVARMIDITQFQENVDTIPLNHVRHKELERVVKFCEHCVEVPNVVSEIENIQLPITTFRLRSIFSTWIADFVSKIPIGELFDLLAAAHFMQVDLLVKLITIPVSMLIIHDADGGKTNKIFTECNGKGKKRKEKGGKSAKVTKTKHLLKHLLKKQFPSP